MTLRVAAVDLGATSVRVGVVDLAADRPQIEIVHRWFHTPEQRADGSLRWRWAELVANVRAGLDRALAAAPLASIGIDGWAVDYGLLGDDGTLLSDPHSYRSARTAHWRELAASLGAAELYRRTGIQLMPINTVFQLAAHDRDELERASALVMLPELVAYELTGTISSERTNAATTGLLELTSDGWATDLVAAVGVEPAILPAPEQPGRVLGEYRGTEVRLVSTHDTACAFAASPLDGAGRAFVSAGTWFLVGIERDEPDVSDAARAANFSNERGALGGYRLLKNVTGLWLLEQCARRWGRKTRDLLDLAATATEAPLFEVGDGRLLAPARMDDAIREVAELPGADEATIARSIVESVAAGVASVLDELRRLRSIEELVVVGGAAGSSFVRERLSAHTGLPVSAGATEATSLGNALVQGVGLGRFADLEDARAWIRRV